MIRAFVGIRTVTHKHFLWACVTPRDVQNATFATSRAFSLKIGRDFPFAGAFLGSIAGVLLSGGALVAAERGLPLERRRNSRRRGGGRGLGRVCDEADDREWKIRVPMRLCVFGRMRRQQSSPNQHLKIPQLLGAVRLVRTRKSLARQRKPRQPEYK